MDNRRYVTLLIFFEVCVIAVLLLSLIRSVNQHKRMPHPVFMARLVKDMYVVNAESKIHGFYEPTPLHTEIQFSEWYHPKVRYTINADTLNDRFDYDVQKNSRVFRIATLGDSFTFGMYVNTQENYSERLEDMMRALPYCGSLRGEVINLGVPGYDIEFSKERYMVRGQKYNPDLLILFIVYNDFTERSSMSFSEEPSIINDLISEGYSGDKLLKQASIRMTESMHRLYGSEKSIGDFQERSLQELLDGIGETPIMLVIDSHVDLKRQKNIVALAASRSNVQVLKLGSFPTFPDTHPNVMGHIHIAKRLYTFIETHQNAFCSLRKM